MIIIITGDIGVGKTTVCQKFIDLARSRRYQCAGVITYKRADGDIIIEDVQTGETREFASTQQIYSGPQTAKYYFNPEAIDFGIQAIDKGSDSDIVLIDELGILELNGQGFLQVPEQINKRQFKKCLVVIRKQLLQDFLSLLVTKPLVFETTVSNRNTLPNDIFRVAFTNHD
jgi:nucleoside-triphosphatase THEP1